LIKEGEWDNKEFIKMQEKLLEQLQIKHNSDGNVVISEKLSALEKLDKKLEKLDKLETLEKSYCEKLEKLDKLETLEKSHCEILDKLETLNKIEKLLEEMHTNNF
ncbi:hypothetical protein RhiirA5_434007, partial [Rhizophagus irregularis]